MQQPATRIEARQTIARRYTELIRQRGLAEGRHRPAKRSALRQACREFYEAETPKVECPVTTPLTEVVVRARGIRAVRRLRRCGVPVEVTTIGQGCFVRTDGTSRMSLKDVPNFTGIRYEEPVRFPRAYYDRQARIAAKLPK